MTRVLVLMDFSAAALAALRVARAAFPDGALRVLHVVSPGVDPTPGGTARRKSSSRLSAAVRSRSGNPPRRR